MRLVGRLFDEKVIYNENKRNMFIQMLGEILAKKRGKENG